MKRLSSEIGVISIYVFLAVALHFFVKGPGIGFLEFTVSSDHHIKPKTVIRLLVITQAVFLGLVCAFVLYLRPRMHFKIKWAMQITIIWVVCFLLCTTIDKRSMWVEDHAVAYLQSIALFLIVLTCFIQYYLIKNYLPDKEDKPKLSLFWFLQGLAFTYASIDERFEVHERLGDKINAWWLSRTGNPFEEMFKTHAADDLFIVLFGLGALIFALIFVKVLWREYIQQGCIAPYFFFLGIGTLMLAGYFDGWGSTFPQIEEAAELTAETSFFLASSISLIELNERYRIIRFRQGTL